MRHHDEGKGLNKVACPLFCPPFLSPFSFRCDDLVGGLDNGSLAFEIMKEVVCA